MYGGSDSIIVDPSNGWPDLLGGLNCHGCDYRQDDDTGSTDTLTVTGTDGPDQMILRCWGMESQNISLGAGDDSLILDYSDPTAASSGQITYDGGAGTDSLKIIGSAGEDVLNYTDGQVVFDSGVASATITLTNVEQHEVDLGAGSDTLNITDAALTFESVVMGSAQDSCTDKIHVTGGTVIFKGDVGHTNYNSAPAVSVVVDDLVLRELDEAANVTFAATQHLAVLDLRSAASVRVERNEQNQPTIIVTEQLSLDENSYGVPTARLDLTVNNLIIDYTASGVSPLADVAGWIRAGANFDPNTGNLQWNGTGITSSAIPSGPDPMLYAVGVRQAVDAGSFIMQAMSTLGGVTLGTKAVVVKYTYIGDMNLDGVVNQDDYDVMDYYQVMGTEDEPFGAGWWTGDLNGDGVTDQNDYNLADYGQVFQGDPL